MKGENNTNIEYPNGTFTAIVLAFLEYKRSLGYKYDDGKMYALRGILNELNRFITDEVEVTREMVLAITEKREKEVHASQAGRATLIRQLAIFMNGQGYKAYVLPPLFIRYERTKFKAFIYTSEEITNLIKECDTYCKEKQTLSLSSQTVYPFLVRVLYACGLRISEVLRLKSKDVNLIDGYITIRESKNEKSRSIPMSESLVRNLYLYEDLKTERQIISKDGSYFPAPDGERLSKSGVSRMIKIWIQLVDVRKTSQGKYPRIHDLRHTAAVRILENLDREHHDLNLYLPLLSVFLGHDTMAETEQYLQFPVYSFNKLDEFTAINSIIPEAGDGYEK